METKWSHALMGGIDDPAMSAFKTENPSPPVFRKSRAALFPGLCLFLEALPSLFIRQCY